MNVYVSFARVHYSLLQISHTNPGQVDFMHGYGFYLLTGPDQTAPLDQISWTPLVYRQKCRGLN